MKDSSAAATMINARSETAGTKPAFRDALKSRRCLIPADGFYEWQRVGKTKHPYCFEVGNAQMFAFAGIWDRWKDPSGNWVKTCSILTTTPNAVTSAVHDRMPVILDPDSYDLWLDPGMQDAITVSDMLKPCDAQLMRRYPISTRINHVVNDDARNAPHPWNSPRLRLVSSYKRTVKTGVVPAEQPNQSHKAAQTPRVSVGVESGTSDVVVRGCTARGREKSSAMPSPEHLPPGGRA